MSWLEEANAKYPDINLARLLGKGPNYLDPSSPPARGGVYYVRSFAPGDPIVKIGFAGKSVAERIRYLRCAHPWPVELMAVEFGARRKREREIHGVFSQLRLSGGGREWFRLTHDLAMHIFVVRQLHDSKGAAAQKASDQESPEQ